MADLIPRAMEALEPFHRPSETRRKGMYETSKSARAKLWVGRCMTEIRPDKDLIERKKRRSLHGKKDGGQEMETDETWLQNSETRS